MSSASPQKVYALTICGYRKPGMSEEDYHEYVSQRHAPCLKELLVKNGILDYTVQHNTTEDKKMMDQIFPSGHRPPTADFDTVIQITFEDIKDYLAVLDDVHFKQVVMPDHKNFADADKTMMTTGWFERHV